MSERYIRVFSLPEWLYAEGSPVIIMAGAILKDTKMGGVLAQLKFQSISDKTIKAMSVRLSTFDTANVPLGKDLDFQYLDLSENRGDEFGDQTPIPLPLAETRAFSVVVTRVIFTDNTIWSDEGNPWESLPPLFPLRASLKNYEVVKQFEMTYGGSCLYQEEKDLWRCVCGCWNRKEENTCFKCKKNATDLSAFDMDELEAATKKRLAEEEAAKQQAIAAAEAAKQRAIEAERKAKLEKEEKARREAEERKQKATKRKAAIMKARKTTIILIIIVLISIPIKKNIAYNDAIPLKLKGTIEEQSPQWLQMRRLSEIFRNVSYNYDGGAVTVTFSFAKQKIEDETLETAIYYADWASDRLYRHIDNGRNFDCTVLLYEDSNKNHLLYSTINGEGTDETT